MVITSKQTMVDDKGHNQSATKWLLDVMTSHPAFGNPAATTEKVFRIDNDQVLSLLGLERRVSGFRYSIEEFGDPKKMKKLIERAHEAQGTDGKPANEFDANVLEFAKHVQLYVDLSEMKTVKIIPPMSPGQKDWKTLIDSLREEKATGQPDPAARAMLNVLVAYGKDDADGFNTSLADYRREARTGCRRKRKPPASRRSSTSFSRSFFAPSCMYWCACWPADRSCCFASCDEIGPQPMRRTAFWLAVLTLVVHTFGPGAACGSQGRPPVTNLYSSAVFIGWGCVAAGPGPGMHLPQRHRQRRGRGRSASCTLLIAHHLALQRRHAGDDAGRARHQLLARHARHLRHARLHGHVRRRLPRHHLHRPRRVHARRCDRDHGQDARPDDLRHRLLRHAASASSAPCSAASGPTSRGAASGAGTRRKTAPCIIVLWNALILHARWGGLVKQRGMAVLAIFGNIVTTWSWFGINMLGVGLHSYGFMSGAVFWLGIRILQPGRHGRRHVADAPVAQCHVATEPRVLERCVRTKGGRFGRFAACPEGAAVT